MTRQRTRTRDFSRGLFLLLLLSTPALPQTRAPRLPTHLHPALRNALDLGRIPESHTLPTLSLTFRLADAKRAELEDLLTRQQTPGSPDFHRWLTPEQYAARFGAPAADIAATRAWLESQGLRITSLAKGHDRISFTGPTRRVEAAFRTELHTYLNDGQIHIANATEPALPADLEPKIAAIHGLHDFRLRAPQPRYNSSTGAHYLAPDDFATIYNVRPLYARGLDGKGQKIAIVGQTQVPASDLQLFRTNFNLPAQDPQMILVPGSSEPGIVNADLGEALLDIQWTGAVARAATQLYVYSFDVTDAAYYVIDQNLAPVLSMSYGLCEPLLLPSEISTFRSYSQRAAAQGITWLAASGDAGAADCHPSVPRTASLLAVDVPASLPEVTGIGGTTFNEGAGTYWSATNDANRASALSYIPEVAWNDVSSGERLSASGGGASTQFEKPAWQAGPGVPADGRRDVPDIALNASSRNVGYLIYQNGALRSFGGTSAGAPAFAGVVALLNQYQVANGLQATAGMGNINPRLYAMAVSVPAAFHDITTGNNIVNPCPPSATTCTSPNLGYNAGVGYDQVTGLGTIDAFTMVTNWGAPAPKAPVSVSLASSLTTLPLSGATVLTASLTSANGTTPTGTVTFFSGSTLLGSSLISGTGGRAAATLALPASRLAVGTVRLTATYNGDGIFAAATSAETVISVTPATSMVITGAVNAASFKPVAAPGMILAVFGDLLAPDAQSTPGLPLPTTLAGVTATINGIAAPLYYVSPTQINLQVPPIMPPGQASLRVTRGSETATAPITISAIAPGVFVNPTNNAPVPDQTAKRGQTISLYLTGAGASTNVAVTVGGIPAQLTYAGIPAWAVGVMQVNYTVPSTGLLGSTPVVVTVGGVPSPPVTLTLVP